jgi:glutathione S-transferase
MKVAGIPFRELVIPLRSSAWDSEIGLHSPSRRVPVLKDGDIAVWDSLAIVEYLAERHPEARLWPADRTARAVARSAAAEMHSGFSALRTHMPMNLRANRAGQGRQQGVADDIARIVALWRDCRTLASSDGPFLFGAFCAADALFAPVVTRFKTYAVALDPDGTAYCDAVLALPALDEWYAAARSEPWKIAEYEMA